MTDAEPARAGRGRLITAAAIVAVLLGAGGFLIGYGTASAARSSVAPPTTNSAAAGFLRDMQVHHAQAVEMALLIRDRTDPHNPADDAIRQLAYDITVTQAGQSGQMFGLLEAWNLPQASRAPAMTWMSQPPIAGATDPSGTDAGDHQMDGMATDVVPGTMPGLATPAQMAELTAASGTDAQRIFLTLMIAHHRGGVAMADAVLARTTEPHVVSMATGIVAAQTSEITAMQSLLAALG
ncbi:MAG TPA: DUF305 domain-containing protein [Pseudolysinimonas sp.]|nr:DUF305 domain-containing protein [Pseudolysinimonas sp.]